jgi:quercetin dioxygenase-like cupin family protein
MRASPLRLPDSGLSARSPGDKDLPWPGYSDRLNQPSTVEVLEQMSRNFIPRRFVSMCIASLILICAAKDAVARQANFTGTVTRLEDTSNGVIVTFRFEAGSRTKWHTHEIGQIILADEGVAHVQERGGPLVELRAGDTNYVGSGIEHWHGASPTEAGVQFNVTRGAVSFGDEVSDEDFNAPPE